MNNKQKENKKDSPLKRISKMYDKLTYFDQYGGTVIMFILITLVFFVMWSYSYVMINSKKIKDDWQNQKCKAPIPFRPGCPNFVTSGFFESLHQFFS
jgi:hypothetical protein